MSPFSHLRTRVETIKYIRRVLEIDYARPCSTDSREKIADIRHAGRIQNLLVRVMRNTRMAATWRLAPHHRVLRMDISGRVQTVERCFPWVQLTMFVVLDRIHQAVLRFYGCIESPRINLLAITWHRDCFSRFVRLLAFRTRHTKPAWLLDQSTD